MQIVLLHPKWKRALVRMFAGLSSNPASAARPYHPARSDEQLAGQLLAHFSQGQQQRVEKLKSEGWLHRMD